MLWSVFFRRRLIKIAKNEGKKFEEDFKKSCPDTCWIYRLKDNPAMFDNSVSKFTSYNICDFIMFDDLSHNLMLLELKSTKYNYMSLSMIRETQIEGFKKILKANHNIVCGFIFNFRGDDDNDTYFMSAQCFNTMVAVLGKKSFNKDDLEKYCAVKIPNEKKRTRYRYDLKWLAEYVADITKGVW